jgi:hypothetical protein
MKLKKVGLIISIILSISYFIVFIPLRNIPNLVEERLEGELLGIISDQVRLVKVNQNPIDPTYIYIANVAGDVEHPDSFRIYYVLKLHRIGIVSWEINEEDSFKGLSKLNTDQTINTLKIYLSEKINEDPMNLSINRLDSNPSFVNEESPLEVSKYFNQVLNPSRLRYTRDFVNLKLGSKPEDIEKDIGKPDLYYDKNIKNNIYEVLYKVFDDGVHCIVLSFDRNPQDDLEAKLINAKIIYNDKYTETLDLEK